MRFEWIKFLGFFVQLNLKGRRWKQIFSSSAS